jgi:hypothetical protein
VAENNLPERIFCVGSMGSRWSYIIQTLESMEGSNISDRIDAREWHNVSLEQVAAERNPDKIKFTGHKGNYFGRGMDYEAIVDADHIDQAWSTHQGAKFIKSHEWAYKLDEIKEKFPDAWILMVYRPDIDSFAWWHQVGGFSIDYPKYDALEDHTTVYCETLKQNKAILDFSTKHDCTWNHFTNHWVEKTFGRPCEPVDTPRGVLVTVVK